MEGYEDLEGFGGNGEGYDDLIDQFLDARDERIRQEEEANQIQPSGEETSPPEE